MLSFVSLNNLEVNEIIKNRILKIHIFVIMLSFGLLVGLFCNKADVFFTNKAMAISTTDSVDFDVLKYPLNPRLLPKVIMTN